MILALLTSSFFFGAILRLPLGVLPVEGFRKGMEDLWDLRAPWAIRACGCEEREGK